MKFLSRGHRPFLPLTLLLVSACLGTGQPATSDGGQVWAELGLTDSATLEFEPLKNGDDLPVGTFGQGGHHVGLAVACDGFGTKAYVEVSITNLDGEGQAELPPFSKPQPLLCDEGPCRFPALYVMLSGLPKAEMLDGLHVHIDAAVHDGGSLRANTSIQGFLRMPPRSG